MNIFLLVVAFLLQAIFSKNPLYVKKKIRVKFGFLFWDHKSRLAFLVTVILLKVL